MRCDQINHNKSNIPVPAPGDRPESVEVLLKQSKFLLLNFFFLQLRDNRDGVSVLFSI